MLHFNCLPFHRLSIDQLYSIMKLRQEVFVVEQNCPYLDADDKDQESYHVIGVDKNGTIQAYTRLVPPGISYQHYSSIGRVVTSSEVRGKKMGSPLMQFSIERCTQLWPQTSIKISAQIYIVNFYSSLGFVAVGDEYLEDDIPHIAMLRKVNS